MKFKKEIQKLIKNVSKIPDNYWTLPHYNTAPELQKMVCWFMDRQKPSVQADYSFNEERFGLTRDGKIIWGFDSGCSCPSPWEDGEYTVKTWKEFQTEPETAFDAGWEDECYATMQTILKDL